MQEFTGFQYLLIDAANHWGLDKETYDVRLQWAESNIDKLEQLALDRGYWKEYPLFMKACMAIRETQQGKPTGHLVAFDAVCSGMQLMSVMTGCKSGGEVTGLIDPNKRADAYTELTKVMSHNLRYDFSQERDNVKQACMTSLYASRQEPINCFGEDTPELEAFYKSMGQMAPGACELLAALLLAWQPVKAHEWSTPDGFHVRIKTMVKCQGRMEMDSIKSSFTYVWYENQPVEKDRKLAANMVHSMDAYVLRSLIRRCSYDPEALEKAYTAIEAEILARYLGEQQNGLQSISEPFSKYLKLYQDSKVVDTLILEHLDSDNVVWLSDEHLRKLARVCKQMSSHKPFDVITIHDSFACHPNYMNYLRDHYRNILADIADGDYLSSFFSQIYGKQGNYNKKSSDLGSYIRQSNYALS